MATEQSELVLPKAQSWQMFDQISKKYDLLNRILSFGQDVSWRKRLISYLPNRQDLALLDLATGTADVAITLVEASHKIKSAVGLDMAQKMLDIGQKKVEAKGLAERITLTHGDGQDMPFEDKTFDVATISFGIRNIPKLNLGLMEMYRVLKPEGRVIILEFSMPSNPVIRLGNIAYLRWGVPLVGYLFSGNYEAYKYLNQTIEQFPYGQQFCRIMQQVGFKKVEAHPLMLGAASIYVGEK